LNSSNEVANISATAQDSIRSFEKPGATLTDREAKLMKIINLLKSVSPKVLRKLPYKVLSKDQLEFLCREAKQLFMRQPMLIELNVSDSEADQKTYPERNLVIVGDIHGQFFDLLYILQATGFPPKQKYLFLGDYVDRGDYGIETISLLFALKLMYPDEIFLLRGNHEDQFINKIYGFFDECKTKSSVKTWRLFCESFQCMPIAALVDEKIFCCHGGISQHLTNFKQIREIQRPCKVPDRGLMCDILWSDPDPDVDEWAPNDRGVSFVFGYDPINKFLEHHNLDLICRAHQIEEAGYAFHADKKLITIFSARNYCGEYDNSAAVLKVNSDLVCLVQVIEPKQAKVGKK